MGAITEHKVRCFEQVQKASVQMLFSPSTTGVLHTLSSNIYLMSRTEKGHVLELLRAKLPYRRAAWFTYRRLSKRMRMDAELQSSGKFLSKRARRRLSMISIIGMCTYLKRINHQFTSRLLGFLDFHLRLIVEEAAERYLPYCAVYVRQRLSSRKMYQVKFQKLFVYNRASEIEGEMREDGSSESELELSSSEEDDGLIEDVHVSGESGHAEERVKEEVEVIEISD